MVEFFGNIRVDWLGKRKLFFAITTLLVFIGAVSLIAKRGFHYGVDFQGGTIVTVRFNEKTDIGKIREAVPNADIQATGQNAALLSSQNEFLIQYKGANDAANDASQGREAITQALNKSFPGKFEIRNAQSVGPKVGHDLRQQAVFAALHDTLITLGMFSVFNREINLTVIAALLTLVGYSMNDTIVVFDRVRENLKIRRRDDLATIMNDSINQTLSRTILTSGLTFLTVLALFIFGGEIINHFAFAMVIGIIIGTYSSIAIASPLVLIYSNLKGTFARQSVSTAKVPNKVPKPAKAK